MSHPNIHTHTEGYEKTFGNKKNIFLRLFDYIIVLKWAVITEGRQNPQVVTYKNKITKQEGWNWLFLFSHCNEVIAELFHSRKFLHLSCWTTWTPRVMMTVISITRETIFLLPWMTLAEVLNFPLTYLSKLSLLLLSLLNKCKSVSWFLSQSRLVPPPPSLPFKCNCNNDTNGNLKMYNELS